MNLRAGASLVTAVLLGTLAQVGAWAQHQPVAPRWFERAYQVDPEILRQALITALAEEGLSVDPEPVDGELLTDWGSFCREDFGRNVAHDAPMITRTYPYLQPIDLATGRFRVRARLQRDEVEALLRIRVDLLAHAQNRITHQREWVERVSNGVIDEYMFRRVERELSRSGG